MVSRGGGGGGGNFDCNAHDNYSHMEAKMAVPNINMQNMQEEIHLIYIEQQQKEKYRENW